MGDDTCTAYYDRGVLESKFSNNGLCTFIITGGPRHIRVLSVSE
jgi:hypothetical protein